MRYFTFIMLFLSTTIPLNSQKVLYESSNFSVEKLAEGVYACIHKIGGKAICNSGIIDNGEVTIIFDSFLEPDAAQELEQVAKALQLSPIRFVVNSHYHNDHTRGNQAFKSDVSIISTKVTRDLIAEWSPIEIEEEKIYAPIQYAYYDSLYQTFDGDTNSLAYATINLWRPYYEVLSKSHLTIQQRLPNILIDEEMIIKGPKRTIHLISKGAGHSESDLILYIPEDKILFTGDLVFERHHPYLGHGDIPAWKNWLKYLALLDAATVVPGHGEVTGSSNVIYDMITYIEKLGSIINDYKMKAETPDEIKMIPVPEEYSDYMLQKFFVPNLTFLYSKL